MELRIINQNEDKTLPEFASDACQQVLKIYDEYYLKTGFHLPWVAYFVVEDNEIKGCCSFVNPPKDNTVEIAYWTFPDFESQGIASSACSALVEIAYRTTPVMEIIAKTAPEQNASTHILLKNNFIYSGIVQDDDIGDAWLWKHKGAEQIKPG